MFYARLLQRWVVMGIVYHSSTKVAIMETMVQGEKVYQALFETWHDIVEGDFRRCDPND